MIQPPEYPPLRPDATMGPPDFWRGFEAVTTWLRKRDDALYMRTKATDADVRAVLYMYPELINQLRARPGPYANHVAEADAQTSLDAVNALLDQHRRR